MELLELYVSVVYDPALELIKHLLIVGSPFAEELWLVLSHSPQVHLTLKNLFKVLDGCTKREMRGRKMLLGTRFTDTLSYIMV